MKVQMKKIISAILILSLCLPVISPSAKAFAASTLEQPKKYKDVTGHTYEEALNYVIKHGLMSGRNGYIKPDAVLTKGEACLSLNALLGAYEPFPGMEQVGNLSKGSPYYDIVSIGLQCGYLKQKPNKDVYLPTAQAAYKYISDIFSGALGIDMKTRIIGNNKANDTLTKGEYANLLYELIGGIVTENTKKVPEGDIYITKPDVTIANVTINGNLIITDAVAYKDVTLHNVNVTGNLIVRGGGENSVNITGISQIPHSIVKQVNHNVSIKINKDSKVGEIIIRNGSKDVNIIGSMTSLTIESENSGISLTSGQTEEIVVKGKETNLKISNNYTIKNIYAEDTAENLNINLSDKSKADNIISDAKYTYVFGTGTTLNTELKGEGSSISLPASNVSNQANNPADSGYIPQTVINVPAQPPAATPTPKPAVTEPVFPTVFPTLFPTPDISITPAPEITPKPKVYRFTTIYLEGNISIVNKTTGNIKTEDGEIYRINEKESIEIYISAPDDKKISRLAVNGNEISEAYNLSSYVYTISSIEEDINIVISFYKEIHYYNVTFNTDELPNEVSGYNAEFAEKTVYIVNEDGSLTRFINGSELAEGAYEFMLKGRVSKADSGNGYYTARIQADIDEGKENITIEGKSFTCENSVTIKSVSVPLTVSGSAITMNLSDGTQKARYEGNS